MFFPHPFSAQRPGPFPPKPQFCFDVFIRHWGDVCVGEKTRLGKILVPFALPASTPHPFLVLPVQLLPECKGEREHYSQTRLVRLSEQQPANHMGAFG